MSAAIRGTAYCLLAVLLVGALVGCGRKEAPQPTESSPMVYLSAVIVAPDGQQVAVYKTVWQGTQQPVSSLWVISLETGQARCLLPKPLTPSGGGSALAWLADSSGLICAGVVGHYYGLLRLPLSGAGPSPLPLSHTSPLEPVPSPDGRWLAYQRYEKGHTTPDLRVASMEGKPDVLVAQPKVGVRSGDNVQWSADSKRLVFLAMQEIGRGPYVGIASVAPVEMLPPLYLGEQLSSFSLSPDGTHLVAVYTQLSKVRLAVVDFTNQIPQQNLEQHPSQVSHPEWAPDGSAFCYVRSRGKSRDLVVYNLQSGKRKTVARKVGQLAGGMAWTPQDLIVFTRNGKEALDSALGRHGREAGLLGGAVEVRAERASRDS